MPACSLSSGVAPTADLLADPPPPLAPCPTCVQWEQQWGAECSSMLFELPHFALELLVVLPCVQVRGGRRFALLANHTRGLYALALQPLEVLPCGQAGGGATVGRGGLSTWFNVSFTTEELLPALL